MAWWMGATAMGVGAIAGGFFGGRAAKKAAEKIAQAMREAEAGLQFRFEQARSEMTPYMRSGREALTSLQSMLVSPKERQRQREYSKLDLQTRIANYERQLKTGQIGAGQVTKTRQDLNVLKGQLTEMDKQAEIDKQYGDTDMTSFIQNSPAYQYALKLTQRSLAASGMGESGEAIRQHGGVAAQAYQQTIGNLQNLVEGGRSTTGQFADLAARTGGAEAQARMGVGQAQAQGIMGQAAAIQGAISGVAGAVASGAGAYMGYQQNQQLLSMLSGRNTGSTVNFVEDGGLFSQRGRFGAQRG